MTDRRLLWLATQEQALAVQFASWYIQPVKVCNLGPELQPTAAIMLTHSLIWEFKMYTVYSHNGAINVCINTFP